MTTGAGSLGTPPVGSATGMAPTRLPSADVRSLGGQGPSTENAAGLAPAGPPAQQRGQRAGDRTQSGVVDGAVVCVGDGMDGVEVGADRRRRSPGARGSVERGHRGRAGWPAPISVRAARGVERCAGSPAGAHPCRPGVDGEVGSARCRSTRKALQRPSVLPPWRVLAAPRAPRCRRPRRGAARSRVDGASRSPVTKVAAHSARDRGSGLVTTATAVSRRAASSPGGARTEMSAPASNPVVDRSPARSRSGWARGARAVGAPCLRALSQVVTAAAGRARSRGAAPATRRSAWAPGRRCASSIRSLGAARSITGRSARRHRALLARPSRRCRPGALRRQRQCLRCCRRIVGVLVDQPAVRRAVRPAQAGQRHDEEARNAHAAGHVATHPKTIGPRKKA